MAGALARRGHLRRRERRPPAPLLRPEHVPVPVGSGAHGPRPQLHLRRPHRPLPDHAGLRRPLADGLRLLRPARRERRHQDGPPPAPLHRRAHRAAARVHLAHRRRVRLAPRGQEPRHQLHQVVAVDLPPLPRGGAGVPQGGAGQLGPGRPDGPRQRAGAGRRHRRAVRGRRREARPRAVVLQDHRLRPAAPRRHRRARLARAGQDDAAQLDRPVRGCRVRHAGRRRRWHAAPRRPHRAGLHHASRHELRHDLRRPRPGAPPGHAGHHRRAAGRRRGAGRPGAADVRHRPHELGGFARQAGRLHRLVLPQPLHRRARPAVPRRLRADRLRHGSDHGRAGRGPARLGLRHHLRAAHRAHDPTARRVGGPGVHG